MYYSIVKLNILRKSENWVEFFSTCSVLLRPKLVSMTSAYW
jgi:hypothetical protein